MSDKKLTGLFLNDWGGGVEYLHLDETTFWYFNDHAEEAWEIFQSKAKSKRHEVNMLPKSWKEDLVSLKLPLNFMQGLVE